MKLVLQKELEKAFGRDEGLVGLDTMLALERLKMMRRKFIE